jgi:predicted GNAT family acetyltransferase
MERDVATEIRNNVEQSRYELAIDKTLVGIADYRVIGEVVVFPHTEIERSRREQGFGAQLVQFALDDVRAANRRVKPM